MSILPEILLATTAAAGAGAVVVPAARRFTFGSVKEDWMAGEIEIDHIHGDGMTIALKKNTLFRVIRFSGIAYDARPIADVAALATTRATALALCGNSDITCRLFAIKRRKDISYDATWPCSSLTKIGTAEKNHFATSFDIHWHLVVQSTSYAKLSDTCDNLLTLLSKYTPTILTQPKDDKTSCPLTSFLNYLITGEWRENLPSISSNLSVSLPGSDIEFRRDGRIITQIPQKTTSCLIAIKSWPEAMSGEVLGALLALPIDLEICQTALPIEKTKMTAFFQRKSRELNSLAFFGGSGEANEYSDAVEILSEREIAIFKTQFTITISAEDEPSLKHNVARAADIFGRERISYSIETRAAAAMWFNRIPGHERLARPLKLFSSNIASIWPLHNAPSGQQASPWGKLPVRLFGTESGQSYAFQFHVSDKPQTLGHFLVLAPSGSGKTTTIMHLLAGLAKFDGVRSYIFDSREGARFMVESMGGQYQSFDRLALNPLDTDDTPESRHRISLIIKSMLGDHSKDDDIDATIEQMLENAFGVETPDRTFNAIYDYAFQKNTDLQKAFAKWVEVNGKKNLFSHIFNAERDSLASFLEKSHLVGINMNEALNDEELAAPLVMHITNAISQSAAKNAVGFNIFIDEAAALLRNDGFKQAAVEMFREYRKLNGVVGMAFQDPAALHRSGVAEAIIENTATLIIFPNTLATVEDYEPFNLNDEHMKFIKGNHDGRKVMIIRRDGSTGFNETVILDVDLGWLGDDLKHYRSGVDATKHLNTLQKNYPNDWMERL